MRPSRQPRSLSSGRALPGPVGSFLRMRNFLNAIKELPHAEGAPFETPPAAAPQDKGRVSKHAPPRCSQFPYSLESRDPVPPWAPAFAGEAGLSEVLGLPGESCE